MKLYKKWFKIIKNIEPKIVRQAIAIKLGPKTNFEIDILKFSAVVKTDKEVKLHDVPAHHPIKWACIKKAASQTDKRGANKDKIGAEVIIGWIPTKPKIQTINGRKIIIIQKGKLLPTLVSIKFWISIEPLNIDSIWFASFFSTTNRQTPVRS